MTCQSKQKKPTFLQSRQERLEELLDLLLQQLRRLRQEGLRLEDEEFVRRQQLIFLPEMQSRIEVCHYIYNALILALALALL
jgi:hypothetical protein